MADARKDFENKIVEKARSDAGFRKRLLADPNGTIRSLGFQLADTTEWNVLEETGGKLFLVLPRQETAQVGAGGALSDDALQAVAGGGGPVPPPTFSAGCPGCGQG